MKGKDYQEKVESARLFVHISRKEILHFTITFPITNKYYKERIAEYLVVLVLSLNIFSDVLYTE